MNGALEYLRIQVPTAGPLGLVILLYDTLVRDCCRAREAVLRCDVEKRTAEVSHALLVLQELQGRLDFGAGDVARQLSDFYDGTRSLLLEASLRGSGDLFQRAADNITVVRAAWAEAEQRFRRAQTTASQPSAASGSTPSSDPAEGDSQWSA